MVLSCNLLKNIGLSLYLFNKIIICPHLVLSGANPDRFLTFKENKTFGVKTPEFLGGHNADLFRLCLRVQQTTTHSTVVKSPLEFSASAFKFRNRKNKPSSSGLQITSHQNVSRRCLAVTVNWRNVPSCCFIYRTHTQKRIRLDGAYIQMHAIAILTRHASLRCTMYDIVISRKPSRRFRLSTRRR